MNSVEEIYQQMCRTFEERAGFYPKDSCELAVRLYAMAAQIQSLQIQNEWNLRQCFPQTAEGDYLDYHGQLRSLTRNIATCATGELCFSIPEAVEQDLSIPAGTVCQQASGEQFVTTEAGTLAAGSCCVTVPAAALTAGEGGNAAANTITQMTLAPTGIAAVNNPAAFHGGVEAEEDASFRERILSAYQTISNGANASFYIRHALAHSGVTAVQVLPHPRGVGTVDVVLAESGGAPSAALLAEVEADLQEKREIAVDVQVLAPTSVPVAVSAALSVGSGYVFSEVAGRVETAVRDFFNGKLLGKGVSMAQLGNLLYHVEGVENYHLLAPSSDHSPAAGVLPVCGTLTWTEL